jgi:hypothetical protein
MKRSILLLAASCLIFAGSAVAQDEEIIDHVTDDNVIVLQDGNAYQSEDATSTTWLPNEDVLILDDDKIVNKDENEAVDVTPTTPPNEDADEDDAQD